jgi:hypothetical protein
MFKSILFILEIIYDFYNFTLSPISETKIDEKDDMNALYLDSCLPRNSGLSYKSGLSESFSKS